MIISPKLTGKQKTLLVELQDLLNFGGDLIVDTKLNQRSRIRNVVLFAMITAVHNYSESIFYLLSVARSNAAEVLIRPVFETLINYNYIFYTRDSKNLKRFIAKDQIVLIKKAEDCKKFILKYPDARIGDELKNKNWDKFISEKRKEIKKIHGKYKNLKKLPDLRQRIEEIDAHLEKEKGVNQNRSEWLYHQMYWYVSNATHLSFGGLKSFFQINKKGELQARLSGDPDAIQRVSVVTYLFYFYLLKEFAKKFNLFKASDFEKYQKVFNNYSKVQQKITS